jgi:hypothetical protein
MHVEEFLKIPEVRTMLADRYREGVNAAVAGYQHARADEDTVTGALGQALLGRGAFQLNDGRIATWSTQYTRFGSAGKRDPAETRYGADGIFEIELTDDEGITTRKSLLFQSKKEAYTFGESSVRRQARQIASVPGGGIVIDYRPDGFVAVDAVAVARADRERLRPTSLGDVLAEEFVGCSRGSSAYFYDPDRETISILTANGSFVVRTLPVANRIRTRFMQFNLT